MVKIRKDTFDTYDCIQKLLEIRENNSDLIIEFDSRRVYSETIKHDDLKIKIKYIKDINKLGVYGNVYLENINNRYETRRAVLPHRNWIQNTQTYQNEGGFFTLFYSDKWTDEVWNDIREPFVITASIDTNITPDIKSDELIRLVGDYGNYFMRNEGYHKNPPRAIMILNDDRFDIGILKRNISSHSCSYPYNTINIVANEKLEEMIKKFKQDFKQESDYIGFSLEGKFTDKEYDVNMKSIERLKILFIEYKSLCDCLINYFGSPKKRDSVREKFYLIPNEYRQHVAEFIREANDLYIKSLYLNIPKIK